MKMEVIMMIFPGETFLYFPIMRATMSVPPVLPPCEIDSPIPRPDIAPPMIAQSSLPLERAKSCMMPGGMLLWKRLSPNEVSRTA